MSQSMFTGTQLAAGPMMHAEGAHDWSCVACAEALVYGL